MRNRLLELLDEIVAAGAAQNLSQGEIARRAGLSPTRISKLKAAEDAYLSTVERMANAVGLKLTLVPNDPALEKLLNRDLFGAGD